MNGNGQVLIGVGHIQEGDWILCRFPVSPGKILEIEGSRFKGEFIAPWVDWVPLSSIKKVFRDAELITTLEAEISLR